MGLFDRAGLSRGDFTSLSAAAPGRVRVLAWASSADGPVVGLVDRLAWSSSDGWRFVGWHEIASGGWDVTSGTLRWTLVTGETENLLLDDPGSLPDLFRERVDASIVVQQRVELADDLAALIVARRLLDDDTAPLIWSLNRQGESWDAAQEAQADAELARLQAEYDIS